MILSKNDIIKTLEEMKLSDLNELIKEIENHFGITQKNNTSISINSTEEKIQKDEPSEVDIILTDTGPSKVAIIKLIKEITGKELMESKKLIDKLPSIIKTKIKLEEAEEIKEKLISAGASIDFK